MIPITLFGKDHWSTFAYVDCRITDNRGVLDNMHLRGDLARHPAFAGTNGTCWGREKPDGSRFATRGRFLGKDRDGHVVWANLWASHDDIDCIEDLMAAGLVEWHGTGLHPIFSLTLLGRDVASQLRTFKAKGGNFCEFMPSHVLGMAVGDELIAVPETFAKTVGEGLRELCAPAENVR